MRVPIAVCLCLLTFSLPPYQLSTAATVDYLAPLSGDWKGTGKFGGSESSVQMKWELVLGGRFYRLTYTNSWKNSKGQPQTIDGHAYYQSIEGNKYRGDWFDSWGKHHPIQAVFENGALSSTWGTRETETGRTLYKLLDATQMELIDSVQLKDGTWREFHRAMLKRQK